jgi:hypothetical protein
MNLLKHPTNWLLVVVALVTFAVINSGRPWMTTLLFGALMMLVAIVGGVIAITRGWYRGYGPLLAGVLGTILTPISVLSFFTVNFASDLVGEETELPVGDVRAIAADDNNHVCIYSIHFRRIQIYDADGRFIRGWTTQGEVRLRTNDDGRVEWVQRRRSEDVVNTVHVLDSHGAVLDTRQERRQDGASFDPENFNWARAPDGTVYEVRRYGMSHITRTAPTGQKTTFISSPRSWTLIWDAPLGLLSVLGFGMLFYAYGFPTRLADTHK